MNNCIIIEKIDDMQVVTCDNLKLGEMGFNSSPVLLIVGMIYIFNRVRIARKKAYKSLINQVNEVLF